MPKTESKIWLYAATVFSSSALLLVLEVVAGRLIAPYVGVSLYTWTAVIGVILAGLSLGNWWGGVWADRGAGETAAGSILLLSGVACLAIPLTLTFIAPTIQSSNMSLLSSSLVLVLSLFFVPAMLLGVVTPILTTLALKLSNRTGHVVGMMHALAAIGSIFGTFITGYWLIQSFGSRAVVLSAAAILGLLAIPLIKAHRGTIYPGLVLIAVLLSTATGLRSGYLDPCQEESQYFCIRVVEESWDTPPGKLKSLVLDHLLHGSNHSTTPALLAAPYVQLMDELVRAQFGQSDKLNFFYIGGGAYTLPRATLNLYPQAQVTVAELDPRVTQVAKEQLHVETDKMKIHHADARMVLQREAPKQFNVIVADAFHDIAIPSHLVTQEMSQLVLSRLTDDGIYTLNIVDAFPDAKLVKAIIKTLKTTFNKVDVWLDHIPEEASRATYVISASQTDQYPDMLLSQRGLQRRWFKVTEPVLETGTDINSLPLLTDDKVPVERLMAELFTTELGN